MATTPRYARLGLRATPQQEAVLRRAAEATHKSMTDFILDGACQAAEQTLLDQRLFLVLAASHRPCWIGRPKTTHVLDGFNCGKPSLNDWLVRHARRAQTSASARTYVVSDGPRAAGYYSLTVGQIDTLEAPDRVRKGMGGYPIPGARRSRRCIAPDARCARGGRRAHRARRQLLVFTR